MTWDVQFGRKTAFIKSESGDVVLQPIKKALQRKKGKVLEESYKMTLRFLSSPDGSKQRDQHLPRAEMIKFLETSYSSYLQ